MKKKNVHLVSFIHLIHYSRLMSMAEFAYSIWKTIKSRKMDAFRYFKFDYVNWAKVSVTIPLHRHIIFYLLMFRLFFHYGGFQSNAVFISRYFGQQTLPCIQQNERLTTAKNYFAETQRHFYSAQHAY